MFVFTHTILSGTKQVTVVFSLWFLLFATTIPCESSSSLAGKFDVHENVWIKIIDHYVEEIPAEDFDPQHHLQSEPERKLRLLKIKIEFKQSCRATRKMDELLNDEASLTEDEKLFVTTFRKWSKADEQGKSKQAEKLYERLTKIPNSHFLRSEFLIHRYGCHKDINVFVTYVSSEGEEIKTESRVPEASYINYILGRYKTRMQPGETMWLSFLIPEAAADWKIWVTK